MVETTSATNETRPSSFAEIYRLQQSLNDLCGQPLELTDSRKTRERRSNYALALISECGELIDCVLWKHWTAEAKAGRRWEVVDEQNARVETIDILFFLTSLFQQGGFDEATYERTMSRPSHLVVPHRKPPGEVIVSAAVQLLGLSEAWYHTPDISLLWGSLASAQLSWADICVALNLTVADVFRLYGQKYDINVKRQQRNVAQVNDNERHVENRSVN